MPKYKAEIDDYVLYYFHFFQSIWNHTNGIPYSKNAPVLGAKNYWFQKHMEPNQSVFAH
jgi:hypothetical protein